MSYPQPDEARPDWSFSPDHDVRCPRCNSSLNGLYWVMDDDSGKLEGMMLDPCGHVLFSDLWELAFSSREGGERRYGHIIRTPYFKEKK